MFSPDNHAMWDDAATDAPQVAHDKQSGWYGTTCAIATGLVTLWALYVHLPIN